MARGVIKTSYAINKIQDVINKNDIITFEPGIYKITKTLNIPSNKTLFLTGATLRRYCSSPVIMTECNAKTLQYKGAQNIKIIGGTIEGMNSQGYEPTNMILLFHSNNVSIINTTFLDVAGSHAIDIGGCKNTNIIGCKFMGYRSYGRDFREAIQIDFAYRGGIPYFKEGSACFDDTHCDGVFIIGCEFGKSTSYKSQYVAIGTHAQTSTNNFHMNISIKNNIAYGNGCSDYMGFFARIVNMKNVNIIGNVVSNYGRFVLIDTTPTCTAKNKGSKDIVISDNIVMDSDDTFKASSIYVNATTDHKVSNLAVRDNIFDKNDSCSYQNIVGLVLKNNVVK